MASRLRDRIDRTSLLVATFFGIPPAIGTALAAARVTGGEAFWLAVGFGTGIGILSAAFVLLLTVSGRVDPPGNQVR